MKGTHTNCTKTTHCTECTIFGPNFAGLKNPTTFTGPCSLKIKQDSYIISTDSDGEPSCHLSLKKCNHTWPARSYLFSKEQKIPSPFKLLRGGSTLPGLILGLKNFLVTNFLAFWTMYPSLWVLVRFSQLASSLGKKSKLNTSSLFLLLCKTFISALLYFPIF